MTQEQAERLIRTTMAQYQTKVLDKVAVQQAAALMRTAIQRQWLTQTKPGSMRITDQGVQVLRKLLK
jgi:hypothetical protein